MLQYLASSSPTASAAAATAGATFNNNKFDGYPDAINKQEYAGLFGILRLMSLQRFSGVSPQNLKAKLKYNCFPTKRKCSLAILVHSDFPAICRCFVALGLFHSV